MLRLIWMARARPRTARGRITEADAAFAKAKELGHTGLFIFLFLISLLVKSCGIPVPRIIAIDFSFLTPLHFIDGRQDSFSRAASRMIQDA
jgi:hypothetical protein